jgi:hypothetical protein
MCDQDHCRELVPLCSAAHAAHALLLQPLHCGLAAVALAEWLAALVQRTVRPQACTWGARCDSGHAPGVHSLHQLACHTVLYGITHLTLA